MHQKLHSIPPKVSRIITIPGFPYREPGANLEDRSTDPSGPSSKLWLRNSERDLERHRRAEPQHLDKFPSAAGTDGDVWRLDDGEVHMHLTLSTEL